VSRTLSSKELEKYCEAKIVSMELLLDVASEQDDKTYWLARKEFIQQIEELQQVIRLTNNQMEFADGDYVAIPVEQWNVFVA